MHGYLEGVVDFVTRLVDRHGEILMVGRYILAAGIDGTHQLFFLYFCYMDC